MRRWCGALVCLAAGVACALTAGPLTALELEIIGDRVTVSDDSGGEVAILGARREFANHMNVLHRHQEVVSADLVLDSEIGSRSIWVGVDLGTGDWTVHSPGDVAQVKPYAADIAGNVLQSLDGLELPGEELDLVVIRRDSSGSGGQVRVWHGRVHDGGTGDEGDADGWLVAENAKLRRVDQGQGNLAQFQDGDVVIGFDASSLEYFVVEVGAAAAQEEAS